MKPDIHPTYQTARVHCACGTEFTTRTTSGDLSVEVCSSCHPYYTGKQKLMDAAGRVERFRQRYAAK
jgi:large subunit ribosomal protein L31